MNLGKNAANYTPLSPLTFVRRAALVYPERLAVVHGARRFTWRDTYARCRQLGSALARRGIGVGDTVAVMAPNIPEAFEPHFGVAMAGGVLNMLNIRLDAAAIAFILGHGEAKILLTDRMFSATIKEALGMLENPPLVVDIMDSEYDGEGERLGALTYEELLAEGDPDFAWSLPEDEWQAIALNYTSGTTGNPKGVVYHHRGAYLNGLGEALAWEMTLHPRFLWTLPMFHCNGWCFPWTLAAQAGTSICLRRLTPRDIYTALSAHDVTHFCGAPIIMNLLINAPEEDRSPIKEGIKMMTAGAPPPAAFIEKMEAMGFEILHVYGLTEVYGPATLCAWDHAWDELPIDERATLKSRQGVAYTVLEDLIVADPETLEPVPQDGETMGEVMFRGNIVMKGYLKNPSATEAAFAGGWFHSGDLGVWHPDGQIQLKDRSKDIIISGGENISTIEVEGVLYRHPAIEEAAVVARPDEKWGETPCAFVRLKPGHEATAEAIIHYCRNNLAHFKAPKTVIFTELPKTSTGKVQKFILRERAKNI